MIGFNQHVKLSKLMTVNGFDCVTASAVAVVDVDPWPNRITHQFSITFKVIKVSSILYSLPCVHMTSNQVMNN